MADGELERRLRSELEEARLEKEFFQSQVAQLRGQVGAAAPSRLRGARASLSVSRAQSATSARSSHRVGFSEEADMCMIPTTSQGSEAVGHEDSSILRRNLVGRTHSWEAVIQDYQETEVVLREQIERLEAQLEEQTMGHGMSMTMTRTRTGASERRLELDKLRCSMESKDVDLAELKEELAALRDELAEAREVHADTEQQCEARLRRSEAAASRSEEAARRMQQALGAAEARAEADRHRAEQLVKDLDAKSHELVAARGALHVRESCGAGGDSPTRASMFRPLKSSKPNRFGASLFDELGGGGDGDEDDLDEDEKEELREEVESLREELDELRAKLADALAGRVDQDEAARREDQAARSIQAQYRVHRSRKRALTQQRRADLAQLREGVARADELLGCVAAAAAAAQRRLEGGAVDQAELERLQGQCDEALEQLDMVQAATVAVRARLETEDEEEAGTASAQRLAKVLNATEEEIRGAKGATLQAKEAAGEAVAAGSRDQAALAAISQKLLGAGATLRAARGSVCNLKRATKEFEMPAVCEKDRALVEALRQQVALLEEQSREAAQAGGAESEQVARLRGELAESGRQLEELGRLREELAANREALAAAQLALEQARSAQARRSLEAVARRCSELELQGEDRGSGKVAEEETPTPQSDVGDTGGLVSQASGRALALQALQAELAQERLEKEEWQEAYYDMDRYRQEQAAIDALSVWDRLSASVSRMVCCRDNRPIYVQDDGSLPGPPAPVRAERPHRAPQLVMSAADSS